jgi:glycosyltransferase involved in cell wall biosynthesis
VVSESEKNCLSLAGFTRRPISVVPNGVDSNSFRKLPGKRVIRESYNLGRDPVVVFVGNLDYPPNQEALQVLSSIIVPRVRREIPNAKFVIVGKNKGSLNLPGLIFTGFVNSVSDVLNIAQVAVAPLLHGSGTRLKILEYLSCGLPVVSTTVGAEGLAVRDGLDLFLEDNFEDFSRCVVNLLKDKGSALALGDRARALAETRYDWKIIVSGLEIAYEHLISGGFVRH